MKFRSLGSISVIVAALLWSLDGLLRTQLYSLPPAVVVFWEHVLGLILISPIILATFKQFRKLTRKQWAAITGVSFLSGALGTILYTAALSKTQYIPFSVVVLLQQLQPVFAISMAAILLKERLSRRFLFLSALALVAAYWVAFPTLTVNFATGAGTALAALFALGAAASWGTSTAFSKYSLKDTSSIHITAARFALTPVFALGFVFLMGGSGSLFALAPVQWKYIGFITLSTGFVALAIYYFGLKRVPASRSAILELTWPLSALITGYAFLHQSLTTSQFIGAVVLLITVILIARDAQKSERAQAEPLTLPHQQEA
ncbi:MAG TPA: DMT family transporter [Candidatus Saccharimonadia bacterium]|nr:DMT family transporter [Candidatus Saccharimonadia bacterium]